MALQRDKAIPAAPGKGRCQPSDLRTGDSATALATSSVESLPCSSRRVRLAAATGHVVSARFAFCDHAGNGGFQTRGHFGFLKPVEHQLGGQKHGDRIDLVLTGVFRRRTVSWLKNSVLVAAVQILSARFTSAVE